MLDEGTKRLLSDAAEAVWAKLDGLLSRRSHHRQNVEALYAMLEALVARLSMLAQAGPARVALTPRTDSTLHDAGTVEHLASWAITVDGDTLVRFVCRPGRDGVTSTCEVHPRGGTMVTLSAPQRVWNQCDGKSIKPHLLNPLVAILNDALDCA